MRRIGPLVGAIDAGTGSVRFLVFNANTAEVLTYYQIEIESFTPNEGWVDQNPEEILDATKKCLVEVVKNLKQLKIDPNDLVAIGITNQRETTIVWDPITGQPLCPAIVWMDMRTTGIVDELLDHVRNRDQNYLKPLCGLPLSPYFSALKLKWMMKNVSAVQNAIKDKRCLFGTVDSWLIWNLTGGPKNGIHITDVTNASRTMLMNIITLEWDPTLLTFFKIPAFILPKIRSSSEIYGRIADGPLQGIPISGCLGDQQSALVGQMCFQQGQAKSTYGTGCFLLYNTGPAIAESTHGMLTTVAYKMGPNATTMYALEGSVAIAGKVMQWLRDNLNILDDVKDSENITKSITSSNGNVVFVPAFSGLYAPYWKQDARSVICGITENTDRAHIIKAALEAVCFQTRDILESMKKDTGLPLSNLLVDGAMTSNNLLMQMQADICGIPVFRPFMSETTALGAAIAAGSAEGIRRWNVDPDSTVPSDVFLPSISEDDRDIMYCQWKMAIERSLGWDPPAFPEDHVPDIQATTASGFFIIATIVILIIAKFRDSI
ncbi:glycerol kinase [Orussus abietinus]|uniref:glycerol kinase n=1 Tax=Orussus abietinus TaxID=222816 RepID=UPI0006267362|nr:glycerol kinase [Orussus abietinus]